MFWPFVDPDHQPWHRPAVLEMVRGVSAEDIKAQQREVEQPTQKELLNELRGDPCFYSSDWIPAPLGRTILRLLALGYQPIETTLV